MIVELEWSFVERVGYFEDYIFEYECVIEDGNTCFGFGNVVVVLVN